MSPYDAHKSQKVGSGLPTENIGRELERTTVRIGENVLGEPEKVTTRTQGGWRLFRRAARLFLQGSHQILFHDDSDFNPASCFPRPRRTQH